jgi:hypothetical protein
LALIFCAKLAVWGVVTVTVKLDLAGAGALPFSSAAQAPLQTPPNKQTIHTVFFMIDPQIQDGREFIGEHKSNSIKAQCPASHIFQPARSYL